VFSGPKVEGVNMENIEKVRGLTYRTPNPSREKITIFSAGIQISISLPNIFALTVLLKLFLNFEENC
jgi:hypothetical protein